MKPTLTKQLKSLMLGGAMALAAGHPAEASSLPAGAQGSLGKSPLDARVSKLRSALESGSGHSVLPGEGSGALEPATMWWRNGGWHRGWGNGGWRNGGFGIHVNL